MSEHWEFYPCQMGEHRAFIFYDHGAKDSINAFPCTTLLKVRATIQQPSPQGLPASDEFPRLTALEDQLSAEIAKVEGLYVGRVTVAGHRYFHYFAPLTSPEAVSLVSRVSKDAGYELRVVTKDDPGRAGYWEDLFPSDEDWQVIQDLKVIQNLEKHGDKCDIQRRIDHWAFFPTVDGRRSFEDWALESGFEVQASLDPEESRNQYGLHFFHAARPSPDEISGHTIALMQKAKSFGGEYDGWETSVERGDA